MSISDFIAFNAAFGVMFTAMDELQLVMMELSQMVPQMKLIEPILDAVPESGDIAELAIYALSRQQELWMTNPNKDKICVSDWVSTIEKFKNLRKAIKEAGFDPNLLVYGIWGWLIANDKTRDAMSGAYKLTNGEGGATWKLSNDIWKESIPGKLNIEIRDGVRYLVQEDEPVQWERLLTTVYDHGKMYYWDDDLLAINQAKEQRERTKQRECYETKESDVTREMHEQVRERLKAQIAEY